MRGARAFSWCPFKKHTSSTNNLSILRQKNNNKPLAAFPPSVRLKEHETKHTSLIPTERLQYKKSLGRIFGAATPPGALGPHQLVVTMEDLAGPHAVGMRIPRVFHAGRSFIFWYSSSSPKAEKMRAADGSAQLMEAHLQLISAEESGKLASHAFAAAAGAAQRARGNEINTAMRSNALLTCRLAVF